MYLHHIRGELKSAGNGALAAIKDAVAVFPSQKADLLASKIDEVAQKQLLAGDRAIGDVYKAAVGGNEAAQEAMHDLRQEIIDYMSEGKYDASEMRFVKALIVRGDDKTLRELVERMGPAERKLYKVTANDLKPFDHWKKTGLGAAGVGAGGAAAGVGLVEMPSNKRK